MVLSSTKLVGELQYWVHQVIAGSELNKNKIPIPVEIPSVTLPMRSFIEMLFNENYPYTSYNYLYEEDTNKYSWPSIVKDRMGIYPRSAKYYRCIDSTSSVPVVDSTATNIFLLQDDDIVMLNGLLMYRMDNTGITVVDTTGTTEIVGTTLYVNYDGLSTNLSKLIYTYLNLKVNSSYSDYDNLTLLSNPSSVLQSCYEAYIIEEVFKFISSRGT